MKLLKESLIRPHIGDIFVAKRSFVVSSGGGLGVKRYEASIESGRKYRIVGIHDKNEKMHINYGAASFSNTYFEMLDVRYPEKDSRTGLRQNGLMVDEKQLEENFEENFKRDF